MKKTLFTLIVLVAACNSSQKTVNDSAEQQATKSDVTEYAATITEEELEEHLVIYASDEFEGRETGSPGQKKAIAYIKKEYEKIAIPAAKSDGDYFQKVPLEIKKVPVGSITINGKTHPIGEGFLTFSAAQGSFDEVVYAGYGVEEGEYSDFSDMDVKGKIVLVKAGEPKNADGTFAVSGTSESSKWSDPNESITMKDKLLQSKGAKGMLYYDLDNYQRFKRYFEYMNNNNSGQMSIKSDDDEAGFAIYIDTNIAKELLSDIDSNHTPSVVESSFAVSTSSENGAIDSENVVAILKGSEKPEEYVVISSHLDHIGVTADGQINNGADDDGSGTVALLEIAEAFKKAADEGNGPKRSIVFLHVTGEEKGLLGSQYYTDVDPILPLEQTVANLNIDMIGRIDPKREGDRNYIYLIGSDKLSTELHELSEEVNQKFMNIELDYTYNDENDPNRFYYRSDHYNFAKNNIPIIFYFNGTHDDYHRPSDTVDKINYDLLENRSRLVFHTAWEIANREARIIVDKASE
ncbi:M28 family peptidase [Maribacter sp. 2307UL18-2]|uniref:M28 family peptidase n=1 Tax=Maribacter sp. 2307UL18-2 TaxID=3386274 RepID=UPI0039BD59BF